MGEKNFQKEEMRFCRLTRFFATIALTAMFVFPVVMAFIKLSFLQGRGLYAVSGLGVLGLVLASLDLPRYRRKETAEEILRFYRNPHYWALVVIISTVAVFAFLAPAERPAPVLVVRAQEPAPPIPPPPPAFPALEVSSVILNGSHSSALIDGKVVVVGEDIHNVTLVEVSKSKIVVRLGEALKEYPLGNDLRQ